MKYCTCLNKKEVNLTIEHKPVKVCSKRLGGCGKEIGNYSIGVDWSNSPSINLDRSMIGRKFRTRSGVILVLIQVVTDPNDRYPFIFEDDDNNIHTTTHEGKFNMFGEHKMDIVGVL